MRIKGIDILDRYRVNHCLPPEWAGQASPISVDGGHSYDQAASISGQDGMFSPIVKWVGFIVKISGIFL